MLIEKDSKIGEIVAENFRAAQVFEKYGLDFCCGGKKTLPMSLLKHSPK